MAFPDGPPESDPSEGPPPPEPLAALVAPLTFPLSVTAEAVAGEEGQEWTEVQVRDFADRYPEGRVSKPAAYYIPFEVPPVAWEYRCETCRFFKGINDEGGVCEVVGRKGDPFGGEWIHREAFCLLWLPQEGRRPLDWWTERTVPPQDRED